MAHADRTERRGPMNSSCFTFRWSWVQVYVRRRIHTLRHSTVLLCHTNQMPQCYLQLRCDFIFVCFWRNSPQWARVSSFTRFLDHTHRRTTVGRTPLDEWSARRRDFYLSTHNTHNRQTSMPPVGFEPVISTGKRLQTHALDRAATGTGECIFRQPFKFIHQLSYNAALYAVRHTTNKWTEPCKGLQLTDLWRFGKRNVMC